MKDERVYVEATGTSWRLTAQDKMVIFKSHILVFIIARRRGRANQDALRAPSGVRGLSSAPQPQSTDIRLNREIHIK